MDEDMKQHWQLDPQFRQEFLDACALAATDDEAFANFRQNDRIATVIENTPKWWADKAMEAMGMTPTMVRYEYTYYLIGKLLSRVLWEDDISVGEIGGGYGGQCKVLRRMFPGISYTIFDLPEPSLLQQRFLLGDHPINFIDTLEDVPEYGWPCDLLISWCAWSELSRELKQEYFDKVIRHAEYIFICSNYNLDEDLEILKTRFNVQIYSDELVSNVIYGSKK